MNKVQEHTASLIPVEIQIFGRLLKVNCPPQQQSDLLQAAENLNSRLYSLKKRSKVTNNEHLIFITALNICYELAQEKLQTKLYANNIKKHIDLLKTTIEQTLIEHNSIIESSNIQFE